MNPEVCDRCRLKYSLFNCENCQESFCSECDSYINGFPLIYSIVRDNYEFFIGSGGRHLLHENVPTIQIRIIKPDLHYDFVDATLLMLFNKHLFLLTNSEDYRKYHSIPSGFFPDRCDRYYFEHHFNKSIFDDYSLVKVGYAGFYTEMRDIHNEKIYVGDVIRGLLHKSSPFQSVITDDGCDSGCDDHEMVFWFGSYDMPTPLSWITNFEIKRKF